jgi:hypothetical protein
MAAAHNNRPDNEDEDPAASQSDVLSAPNGHGRKTGEEQAAVNREDDPPA